MRSRQGAALIVMPSATTSAEAITSEREQRTEPDQGPLQDLAEQAQRGHGLVVLDGRFHRYSTGSRTIMARGVWPARFGAPFARSRQRLRVCSNARASAHLRRLRRLRPSGGVPLPHAGRQDAVQRLTLPARQRGDRHLHACQASAPTSSARPSASAAQLAAAGAPATREGSPGDDDRGAAQSRSRCAGRAGQARGAAPPDRDRRAPRGRGRGGGSSRAPTIPSIPGIRWPRASGPVRGRRSSHARRHITGRTARANGRSAFADPTK